MATNFYFNNFESSQEQLLIENLVVESIRIYGHDLYYLPRTRLNFDSIYGEDPISEFKNTYMIEMYIKNVDGFGGDGDFLSKFNLQIRDTVTFTVARRVFSEEIGNVESLVRPREGDLIYFPLNKKIFEIKFVEHEAIFYQLGALQTFDIKCELFEYSNERFNTGIDAIDKLYDNYRLNIVDTVGQLLIDGDVNTGDGYNLITQDGFQLLTEGDVTTIGSSLQDDSDALQIEAAAFIDFSVKDPFSEGNI